jgi:hypothetical protein
MSHGCPALTGLEHSGVGGGRCRGVPEVRPNKLVDTDARGRAVAARPPLLGRGPYARYVAG